MNVCVTGTAGQCVVPWHTHPQTSEPSEVRLGPGGVERTVSTPPTLNGAGAARPAQSADAEPRVPAALAPTSRRFQLRRYRDVSGVSGIGVVGDGTLFADGHVAFRWRGKYPSTVAWDNLELLLGAHGHDGATVVEWIDSDPNDAITDAAVELAAAALHKHDCGCDEVHVHEDEYVELAIAALTAGVPHLERAYS